MLGNESRSGTPTEALRPTSFSAGANNGPWLPVANLEGDLLFLVGIGALTGSVVFSLEDATDGAGSGAAALSPAVATASLNTAGQAASLVVAKKKIRSHVRVVATVTTGPALCAGYLQSRGKTTP